MDPSRSRVLQDIAIVLYVLHGSSNSCKIPEIDIRWMSFGVARRVMSEIQMRKPNWKSNHNNKKRVTSQNRALHLEKNRKCGDTIVVWPSAGQLCHMYKLQSR